MISNTSITNATNSSVKKSATLLRGDSIISKDFKTQTLDILSK